MARGNRRELIVRDDEDRRTFVRTLGEGCERAGDALSQPRKGNGLAAERLYEADQH